MSTIMVVDDDPDIAEVFRIFLGSEGHTVVAADGGIQCLRLLQGFSPDVILLDLMMHPMDGWATLKAIKNDPQANGIPVIIITGKPQIGNEHETYAALYYDYMLKPIRKNDLCITVARALSSAA